MKTPDPGQRYWKVSVDGDTPGSSRTDIAPVPDHAQPVAPPPPQALPGGVTQAAIDASLAANPKASKGGYEGVGDTYGTTVSMAATSDPSQDWASAFFGALGLPDDVMKNVTNVLRDHAQDPTLAQALATQYIRSTPWYAIHYPGALEGIAKGVINNEAEYASYMNQVNVLSRQYNGRDISGDEIKGYLQAGYDPNYVSKLYAGNAWTQANKADVNYTLGAFGEGAPTSADLGVLGNENAGLDSALGQRLQSQMAQATQRLHAIFRGSLATPSLTLGPNGLQAPSLAGAKQPNDLPT